MEKKIVRDNIILRARFFRTVPCLTGHEVAVLAGEAAPDASTVAARWRQAGLVFSVPRRREEAYPAFQFRNGRPHETVGLVLGEFATWKRPWPVAFWFVSGNGWLDGAAPADRLDDRDAVVEAARQVMEEVIW